MGFLGGITDAFGGGQGANKFRAQLANTTDQDYSGDIRNTLADVGAFRGLNQQAAAQQQQYVDQLNNQVTGNGPSVAQQQLAQALNRNAQNQAASIGSVRGINPALAAKMISDNYGHTGADLAQQGSLLRANEQLGALGQLGGALGQMRGQDIQSQQVTGGLATGLGGLMNQQNANNINNQAQTQGINAGISKQNVDTGAQLWGGLAKGIASAATGLPVGGAPGITGASAPGATEANTFGPTAPGSSFGLGSLPSSGPALEAHGGEIQDPHAHVLAFADGIKHACSMLKGGMVPGKAQVAGDSYANDKVPAMLSPGEIVVPRSKADDPEAAKQFIEAVKEHHGKKKGKENGSYEKVLQAKRKAKNED